MKNFRHLEGGKEVSSAGFKTTVFPAARAGATFQATNMMGKFQATTERAGSMGSRRVKSRTSMGTGKTLPFIWVGQIGEILKTVRGVVHIHQIGLGDGFPGVQALPVPAR